jgi:photosystem II stability/assembly factor-like uncharacterized protein
MWPWERSPFQWSPDGGVEWHPSSHPTADRGSEESRQLLAVGDLVFIIGSHDDPGPPPPLPFIWVSADGGRSFEAGTGVTTGLHAGEVQAVVQLDDRLLALGVAATSSQGSGPTRWESTDQGRTWRRSEVGGAGDAMVFPRSAVVDGGAVLAVVEAVSSLPDAPTRRSSHLLRSLDDGRTWSTVDLRLDQEEVLVDVVSLDGLLAVSSAQRTWTSMDSGQSWRLLGPAPVILDDEGTAPDPAESGGVRIVAASGDDLVAQVNSFYNYDHYLDHLGWSDDGGMTWQAADIDVDCTGREATSTLGGPVRIGSVLVATWTCLGSGDSGGHVLTSTDQGRTWRPAPTPRLGGMDLTGPALLDGGLVVALGAENREESVDVTIRVTVEG